MSVKASKDIKEIDEQTWKELKFITFTNIKSILNSVKVLLKDNIIQNQEFLFDHPHICAGLYTYAIEEYGKLLILESYVSINNKVKIEYLSKFTDHDAKFNIAIERLSLVAPECIRIGKGLFDPAFFDPAIFDTKESITSFKARLAIFYSDFKDNKIIVLPNVDKETLNKAVSEFEKIINHRRLK
ncbi:MAG: AbiV family abortive infection protein [Nitrosotalea sp.]